MNLAVITWFHYRNYGTALQAVALSAVLRQMGHDPQMINYKPSGYYRTIPDYSVSALGRRVYRKLKSRGVPYNGEVYRDARKDACFEAFLTNNLRFTEPCMTATDLERLNDSFDAFICGSDQIWSPLVFNPKYYLDFVHDSGKKIAYAPSIGCESVEDKYVKKEMSKALKQFGALSVREETGRKIIQELSGKEAEVVLDPTLLLTEQQWITQFHIWKETPSRPYMLVYMLGNNENYWAVVQETADYLDLDLRIIPVFQSDLNRDGCVKSAVGPQEFLELIRNAAYVCTDSFHGMNFSLLFHRPFTAFLRFQKSDARNQNTRVLNLLTMTNMKDRIFNGSNCESIANSTLDFRVSDDAIDKKRRDSIQYLTASLQAVKTEKLCRHVMQKNALCCGCGACSTVCPTSAIEVALNNNGFWEAQIDEEKCIHCSKCTAVCPFCTATYSRPAEQAMLYSFKSTDNRVLQQSTSGGAAYAISKILFTSGYNIVGCRYDTIHQQAEHFLVKSEEQLDDLQGSKYIQSNFAGVLPEAKAVSGPIAFFGTPCQIAAAKRVFSGRNDVLYVDLVCHGVPSANLFEKYKKYIEKVSGVDTAHMNMSFRYKPRGWSNIYLYASDGKCEYCRSKTDDPFFRMFEVGNCYNKTCYECRWRVDSEADIRLGDYWGPKFKSDQTGVNMAVCFTETGYRILEKLMTGEGGLVEKQPIEDYLTYQQSLNLPKPVFYDELICALKNEHTKITNLVERYAVPLENRNLSRVKHIRYVLAMMFGFGK